MKVTSIEELAIIGSSLPVEILQDVYGRCKDWIVSGGKEDDPYIKQQLRYVNNYLERVGKNR